MKEIKLTTKITVYSLDECTDIEKKLIEEAKNATTRAYAPYSNFKVGAAILFEDGQILTGNNQENAAYPSGLCAERTTIFYANANFPNLKIVAIAIAAYTNGHFTKEIITPCGGCRQVLLEVENRYQTPLRTIMYSDEGIYVADSIKDLLPLSFGENMLHS